MQRVRGMMLDCGIGFGPGVHSLTVRTALPTNLWTGCRGCSSMIGAFASSFAALLTLDVISMRVVPGLGDIPMFDFQ